MKKVLDKIKKYRLLSNVYVFVGCTLPVVGIIGLYTVANTFGYDYPTLKDAPIYKRLGALLTLGGMSLATIISTYYAFKKASKIDTKISKLEKKLGVTE